MKPLTLPAMGSKRKVKARVSPRTAALVFGWRRFMIETILLLGAFLLVDWFAFEGNRFAGMTPHPFWIVVLLMAAQYGAVGGLFSVMCATAALYVGAMPDHPASQDFYAYFGQLVGLPAAWVGTALAIGGLRSLHIFRAAVLQNKLDEAVSSTLSLGSGLERALAEIERLERRIAGETSTVGAIVRALGHVDIKSRAGAMGSFHEVVRAATGASRVTVFRWNGSAFEGVAAPGETEPPAALSAELAAALTTRTVNAANGADGTLLPSGAILAAPLRENADAPLYGAVVLDRLQPNQDLARAIRRTDKLAGILARLLRDIASADADLPTPRTPHVPV